MPRADRFAPSLLRWFDQHGRHDLPWQYTRTPYRVWLAEIMLQQTQVATVIPYFLRFVDQFASLRELAAASLDDVLALWSGLGYYTRARNLHRAAQICVDCHAGDLPRDCDQLRKLPGIGRSTAAAILAQAHGLPFAILDGNVKRVLARFHGVRGWPGSSVTQKQLWRFADVHTPQVRVADYTQAIMDLGATVCTRANPRCTQCPFASQCVAHANDLTALLPQRKPSRTLPTHSTVMLLLRDGSGRFLLQRRPPTGVWAQLWSLPEAADIDQAKRSIAHDHAVEPAKIRFRHLPSFVHTFSHYRLDVTPVVLEIAASSRIGDSPDRRWLLPAEASQLGLPAPVRKLLENVQTKSESATSKAPLPAAEGPG
ncbi:MAG TPA: A/G-specific adenine glycosylase [Rudaea sp.]|nr:A/G-specific adenine glycosylase [Rudaea sp.]